MCSICDLRIDFGTDHPMGLSVAVATRRAIDAGVIPEADMWDRDKAIPLMHGVQQRLELVHSPEVISALPHFFVLLVETRTWAFFQPGSMGFDRTARAVPPDAFEGDSDDRASMLVVAETALSPILAGKIPFDTAEEIGLIHFDAPANLRTRLQQAWSAAWPTRGFSRFVCVRERRDDPVM